MVAGLHGRQTKSIHYLNANRISMLKGYDTYAVKYSEMSNMVKTCSIIYCERRFARTQMNARNIPGKLN